MGEIADMMLDGTLCQHCGEWMGEGRDGEGYPQCCDGCRPWEGCGQCSEEAAVEAHKKGQ
jgi:hypothetical protein